MQGERPAFEIDGIDVIKNHLRVKPFGVGLEARHEVRALYALGVGRPVLNVRRGHQLTTLREAGDQHWRQVGARRVDRSRVSSRAGAQNNEAMMFCRHGFFPVKPTF